MILPGDLVARLGDDYSDPLRHLRVLTNRDGVVSVWVSEDTHTMFFVRDLVLVRCRNCHQGRSAHTSAGKCLYGPEDWEYP